MSNKHSAKPEARKTCRCAIYTRKSTEEGLEQEFNSLDAQREAGELYVKSQKHEGWECLETKYDDGGFTGANMDRPGLRRLLADIAAGKIDCVVVYKVDRLSRSLLDFAKIIEVFDRHQVTFVSVTQSFNTASSMGRLTLNVLLSFAQFERDMISERTRDKMRAARRKGRWIGGKPILGYNVVNTKLVVDPLESLQVQEIFKLYLEMKSTLQVARVLNQRGWRIKEWTTKKGRTIGGGEFNKNKVTAILTNATYIGMIEYEGQLHPGLQDAIIKRDLFDRVQEILKLNSRMKKDLMRCKHNALLQGLLRCAACNCGMSHSYTKKGSTLYRYYICHKAQKQGWASCPSPSLPAAEIENFVIDQIRSVGQDPGVVRDTLAQSRVQTQTTVERLKKEKNALERAILGHYERLNQAIADGANESAVADIQDQIREKEQRVSEVVDEMTSVSSLMIDESDVRESLGRFQEVWAALSPAEKAKAIRQIVDSIQYDGHSKELSISYHPIGIRTFSQEQQSKVGAGTC
ncbi:DNA-invertase hin [Pirellula sp. SH-Sr6A]|uniref:recombinase family protein n=1 Tax=Pirellula sp. SH-Sr6A TaxID=1632865 RepID=UPI00078E7CFE|nr:recombinase family protein [Pirellula sp. SH-Sr6A]AMV31697.1 DNA-invertase hin [Pirellula sp. SH-Sr6A]